MLASNHHEQDAQEIIERTYFRWEAITVDQKKQVLETMAKQALRNLVKLNGLDETMCFLWPLMEAMNTQLQIQQKGVSHAKAANG